ncbi:Transcriptional regulator, contains XRE-family HTH domain [Chryseolinea serpens]|uniref:Transcriptional regulator, contains XRE-family HTH domain n=1 Tax=Chryseolinea serpens TaxID=947013 RepID=A0A1M5UE30_9BACT|nr:helix-turn-helix transcriptional regulator [Chryseolinea serpens]SHH61315.1 Transcriptional regulator, contains XRE-family HTH domain [Chryseolinea serpens]
MAQPPGLFFTTRDLTKTTHIGHTIMRLHELRQMKQDTLAEALGISQQAISKIEQSEHVEDLTLERIGKVLGFPTDVTKNYNDEVTINNIQTNYETIAPNNGGTFHNCSFNDALLAENKRLAEENKKLTEELLKDKDEKNCVTGKTVKQNKPRTNHLERSRFGFCRVVEFPHNEAICLI